MDFENELQNALSYFHRLHVPIEEIMDGIINKYISQFNEQRINEPAKECDHEVMNDLFSRTRHYIYLDNILVSKREIIAEHYSAIGCAIFYCLCNKGHSYRNIRDFLAEIIETK